MDNVSNSKSNGKFQDFVNANSIICHSNAADSYSIINELIDLTVKNNPALNRDEVARMVFDREALVPTVIAPGLAMPHARGARSERYGSGSGDFEQWSMFRYCRRKRKRSCCGSGAFAGG